MPRSSAPSIALSAPSKAGIMAIALPPIKPVSYNSALLFFENLKSLSTNSSTCNTPDPSPLKSILITLATLSPLMVTIQVL